MNEALIREWNKKIHHERTAMVPEVSTSRILDEFGFPLPEEEKPCAVSKEDVELCKRFLSKLKDQTLSRSIHKVLTDLIGRLT